MHGIFRSLVFALGIAFASAAFAQPTPVQPRLPTLAPQPAWSAWENLGGTMQSPPQCLAPDATRIECYARGQNFLLQRRAFDGTNWQGWAPLAGVTMAGEISDAPGPSCLRDSGGMTHCFVRGDDNPNDALNAGALWHRWLPASGQGWWENLGGVLTSVPSCVAAPDSFALACFGRGTNGTLMGRQFDGNVWGPWQNFAGTIKDVSTPECVAQAGGRIDCVIVDPSGLLQHRVVASAPTAWRNVAANSVLIARVSEYNPRCNAMSGGGVACYAVVETDRANPRPGLLRAVLSPGSSNWSVSVLGNDFGPATLGFSCFDYEAGNFSCFVLARSQGSFALQEFWRADSQWRTVPLQAPTFANSADRLECVDGGSGRIDCFVGSTFGGPLARTTRTPPVMLRTVRARP